MVSCTHCGKQLVEGTRFCSDCGASLAPAASAGGARKKPEQSVVWIVIAILVAGFLVIGGLVAAIAIPNLLNAIDRGKQFRTKADLRSIAAAIEAYRNDHGHFPLADDVDGLERVLEPRYMRTVPTRDAWNDDFRFESTGDSYRLSSSGKDGVPDSCDGGKIDSFDDAICIRDGEFTQWPGDRPG